MLLVTVVHIDVKPECIEAFKEISTYNHMNTRKEAGNYRFDVLQNNSDPTKFTMYEVFADQAAMDFHKQTEHYLKWRDTVADMMSAPRTSAGHSPIAFTDKI